MHKNTLFKPKNHEIQQLTNMRYPLTWIAKWEQSSVMGLIKGLIQNSEYVTE